MINAYICTSMNFYLMPWPALLLNAFCTSTAVFIAPTRAGAVFIIIYVRTLYYDVITTTEMMMYVYFS